MINELKALHYLDSQIEELVLDRKKMMESINSLNQQFNIPIDIAADILQMRTNVRDYNENILYCLFKILSPRRIGDFFTEKEIEIYSTWKYEEQKEDFPIVFDSIQVTNNQWIGTISIRRLMSFRNQNIIRYNEDTQRPLKHVIKGDVKIFRININRKSIRSIMNLMKDEDYIPNTLTFNLPANAKFHFESDTKKLVIEKTNNFHFDIIDGYHRYLAASNLFNQDRTIDFNMELRIVSFNDGKAKQFIYQEAQTNPIKKVDSDSMNQNSVANRIVDWINEDNKCLLYKKIKRNNYIINSSYLSQVIKVMYVTPIGEDHISDQMVDICQNIVRKINILVRTDQSLSHEAWDNIFVACALYSFNKDISNDSLLDSIRKIYDRIQNSTITVRNDVFTKADYGKIKKLAI